MRLLLDGFTRASASRIRHIRHIRHKIVFIIKNVAAVALVAAICGRGQVPLPRISEIGRVRALWRPILHANRL